MFLDKVTKTISLFEVTFLTEENIEIRHKDKTDRYAHFLTYCSTYSPTPVPEHALKFHASALYPPETILY